jgi:nucleoside-diphosphate-sugar epimerase
LLEHVKTSAPELPVVVASSSSVYGIPEELPMEEEMKPRPYSPYGVTKLASENLAMLYHQNFDLNTVALRYFTVYGPRQRPDMAITRFLGWIKQGFTIPIFGDGSQSRDFTYVSDIVDANLTMVEEDVYGSLFNVGGGRRASLNEVIDLLESITGRAVDREYDETQEGDVPHTDADTSKIRSKTSWDPDVGLEEGLLRQWEWLRDNDVVLEVLEEIQEDPTQ